MTSCVSQIDDKHNQKKVYEKITKENLNDSTIEHSYWVNNSSADCFLICYGDTIDRYFYSENSGYFNYTHFNPNKSIYKIKQIISLRGEAFPNESLYFNEIGEIIEHESSYLKVDDYKDSVRISVNFSSKIFDKVRILISNNTDFNINKWSIVDTIETLKPYISLPKDLGNRKCLLQVVKMDSQGRDESGKDFYFDVNNLICRDIKSL